MWPMFSAVSVHGQLAPGGDVRTQRHGERQQLNSQQLGSRALDRAQKNDLGLTHSPESPASVNPLLQRGPNCS